ncbi:DtxR family Mn-dependent transcriptional regulator [Methanofollis sp. W23]|uniref:metal-dependent transcriptional regulator n=1 Tax=Methanofollis sp. W23 TaxID=2817849 RepID=UPI001AE3A270|nr:iron dependent repressor, metal binding and dimerization domain protein [Methanofollis sp. W23]MBP2145491.1 DtxR family Mn-dependent transcriptional regulator [Methanofollis sp. W23]
MVKVQGVIALTRKAEDYLEAILNVSLEKGYARTKDIAGELDVSPSSVVEMFQKLDRMGMVEYRKYEGVTLKPEGEKVAWVIKFRHDTLKSFLMLIEVPEDIADKDACFMEHELHPETIEQIGALVEYFKNGSRSSDMLGRFSAFCKKFHYEKGCR